MKGYGGNSMTSKLAILGGPKAIPNHQEDMFRWPIVTKEDEEAVLEVLRRGGMSGVDVTMKFEDDFIVTSTQ